MILKTYKHKDNMSEEDKQVEQWFRQYCEANGLYDHMTDKQLNKRYKQINRWTIMQLSNYLLDYFLEEVEILNQENEAKKWNAKTAYTTAMAR